MSNNLFKMPDSAKLDLLLERLDRLIELMDAQDMRLGGMEANTERYIAITEKIYDEVALMRQEMLENFERLNQRLDSISRKLDGVSGEIPDEMPKYKM